MADGEEKRRTVRVSCNIVNGVELALFERGEDDGTGSGYRPIVAKGPRVVLKGPSGIRAGLLQASHGAGVVTEVDAEWFDKWWAANQKNPLVLAGQIAIAEEPSA